MTCGDFSSKLSTHHIKAGCYNIAFTYNNKRRRHMAKILPI